MCFIVKTNEAVTEINDQNWEIHIESSWCLYWRKSMFVRNFFCVNNFYLRLVPFSEASKWKIVVSVNLIQKKFKQVNEILPFFSNRWRCHRLIVDIFICQTELKGPNNQLSSIQWQKFVEDDNKPIRLSNVNCIFFLFSFSFFVYIHFSESCNFWGVVQKENPTQMDYNSASKHASSNSLDSDSKSSSLSSKQGVDTMVRHYQPK